MSDNARILGSFNDLLDDEKKLNEIGFSSSICIPLTQGNDVFHVKRVMLHMLKIKGLFGEQSYEDPNFHLKNFIKVCSPFDIAYITPRVHLVSYLPIFSNERGDIMASLSFSQINNFIG